MPDIGLMNPGQVGASIQNAFSLGQQQRQQIEDRKHALEVQKVLGQYVQNQTPENAAVVAQKDPALGLQLSDRETTKQQQQQALMLDQLGKISKLAKWVQSQPDPVSAYQQALGVAQRMGLDVSQAPPQYDPHWIASEAAFTDAFLADPAKMTSDMQNAMAITGKPITDPETRSVLAQMQSKTVPMQPGGSIGAMIPGQPGVQMLVQPNPGGMQAGTPAIPQEAIDALRRGEGTPQQFDELFGQGAAAHVMGGGASGNAGGNFPNITGYYSGR